MFLHTPGVKTDGMIKRNVREKRNSESVLAKIKDGKTIFNSKN